MAFTLVFAEQAALGIHEPDPPDEMIGCVCSWEGPWAETFEDE